MSSHNDVQRVSMTAAEQVALTHIRGYAAANRVRFAYPHAYDRMDERGATEEDVVHAPRTAQECRLQVNGRFRVDSTDLDGDHVTVVVVLEGDVLVVTLF